MKKLCVVLLLVAAQFAAHNVYAQEEESPALFDDIQIDVKQVSLSPKGDTATVDLFLLSYQRHAREFRLNSYATQVCDSTGTYHLYHSMKMGRVLVMLADRQNYIRYFMEEEIPVALQIKVSNWTKERGKPTKVKLVFEDSQEEGKFIETEVNL